MHTKPQLVPSQVGTEFDGAGHGVQLDPQLFTLVSDAQVEPQRWNPGLQLIPQLLPSQVAAPLTGTAHGVHADPQ
ncbi:MAG: hypothetical protein ACK4N5_05445 [Myxococcales bacterium]